MKQQFLYQGREESFITSMTDGRSWLLRAGEVLDRDQINLRLQTSLELLVALWICDHAVSGGPSPECLSRAGRVCKMDENRPGGMVSELLECDAALVLVACGILRVLGTPNETLEQFTEDVADTLTSLPGGAQADSDPSLFVTRVLLHHLGLIPDPGKFHLARVQHTSPLQHLLADVTTIRHHLASISAATRLGAQAAPDLAEALGPVSTFLPVWLADSFRRFNLDLGSSILRGILYVGNPTHRVVVDGVDFILRHQRSNGGFRCHFAGSSHWNDSPGGPDVGTQLLCLWALCESTNARFRLVSSITA
jgi:hypothetical protein